MNFANFFESEGNWYKGNVHLHTTNSDGVLSPEEICNVYRDAGYNFIAITDHRKVTEVENKKKDFLVIPGEELDKGSFHVVGVNLKKAIENEGLSIQQMLDRINEQNAIAIIAHPYWSASTSSDLLGYKGYAAIEVYNNTCEKIKGKGYSSVHWDELLQKGKKVLGLAVDDAHNKPGTYQERDILGSFIMVKAKTLTLEDIAASIKKGFFYSSTGVEIKKFEIAGEHISLSFSPAINVDFIGCGATGTRFSGKGKEIETAFYDIKGQEKFLRIEITDKYNRKCWTNPIFL
jgi:hypothetical protein